ncbi:MAG: diphthine synthase [Candidatus Diapherotrites archaeon]|uniref:Diphthine synthase n=1 Tax=Candidatus Iainarchaeum sp. TaxID=3101447 RepID=A0A8T4C7R0_9ARCH|nr:diphthine synthase [Candidatus Diapherotrites archaeon]
MLYLIGLGLNANQLTLEALHTIQQCSEVYVENYTSKYSQGEITALEKIIAKKIIPLNRKGVEEDADILIEKAAHATIGLLIFGNPLTATTHISLIEECVEKKINYKIIPGISIFNYRGVCGLDEYKFGRTTTFVFPIEGYEPLSTFDIIIKNKTLGLHTHCLFDLHPEKQRFMTIDEAITFIQHAAGTRNVPIQGWIGVGLAGMGNDAQHVKAGSLHELQREKWNVFPQSMIICGDINEKEHESLQKIGGLQW